MTQSCSVDLYWKNWCLNSLFFIFNVLVQSFSEIWILFFILSTVTKSTEFYKWYWRKKSSDIFSGIWLLLGLIWLYCHWSQNAELYCICLWWMGSLGQQVKGTSPWLDGNFSLSALDLRLPFAALYFLYKSRPGFFLNLELEKLFAEPYWEH